jgi:NitT/TauT family transport system substrate-binding protein
MPFMPQGGATPHARPAPLIWLFAILVLVMGHGVAWAETAPVRVAYTLSSMNTGLFVAQEAGLFRKHGLTVQLQQVSLTATIPAALVSGSAEIGAPSTPVFIQAVDGGIDLVALAGTGLATPTGRNEAVVGRIGAPISGPADLVGRRIGVPGIGTIVDVMFRHWLMQNGVQPGQLTILEVAAAQQADALRGGTVDAVVANDPVLFRILAEPSPRYVGYFMQALPGALPIVLFVATGDWARDHRAEVAAFQAATREAAELVRAQPDAARATLALYLKLPANVAKDMEIPELQPDVSVDQLARLTELMRPQDMLRSPIDPAKLVFTDPPAAAR